MGVLKTLEEGFKDLRGSSRFEKAWDSLKGRQKCLAWFERAEDLRDFCHDPAVDYAEKDRIVMALCREAKAERDSRDEARFATGLVFWLFAPALWRVVEQAEMAAVLSPDEIQAEAVEGFWEKAVQERSSYGGISGALVNAARHHVWRAIRDRSREIHEPLDAAEEEAEEDRPDPLWSDPWVLICYAQHQGAIGEIDAELLFWTKLNGEQLGRIAPLVGLSYTAAEARIKRAKENLASWLGQLSDDLPPSDPHLAREVINLAEKPSNLAHSLGRERA
jgi:DNA-directed RNA polymerase specialized sigma24 family protein